MSIILRALKKVQNLESAQKTPDDISPGDPLSGSAYESSTGEESLREQDSHEGAPEEASSASAKAGNRSNRIPWILMGLIAVLGVLATAWFATEIYRNVKPVPAGTEPEARTGPKDGSKGEPVAAKPAGELTASAPGPTATPAPGAIQAPAPTLKEAASEKPPKQRPEKSLSPLPHQVVSAAEPAPEPVAPPAAPAEPEPAAPDSTILETEPAASEVIENPAETPLQSQPKEAEPAPEDKQPQQQGKPELKINAIAWREEEPIAIVNMQRVYVGDVVEGAKVLEIRRKSVIFEYQGEQFEVRF